MVATYNPALLTDIDRMRNILGDVNVEVPYADDETYTARLLLASGSWKLAAASMARSFAARSINDVTSFSAGSDVSVSWTDRAAAWLKIAQSLEEDAARDIDPDAGANQTWWDATTTRAGKRIRSEYARPMNNLEEY